MRRWVRCSSWGAAIAMLLSVVAAAQEPVSCVQTCTTASGVDEIRFGADEGLGAVAAPASPRSLAQGEPPDELVGRDATELGIPEATVAQIQALAEQYRAESEAMMKEVQAQKLTL